MYEKPTLKEGRLIFNANLSNGDTLIIHKDLYHYTYFKIPSNQKEAIYKGSMGLHFIQNNRQAIKWGLEYTKSQAWGDDETHNS